MDFARRQLEKYGWKDGQGLGKHENGIAQPLKPKIKRSVAGIGHDVAADLTEQWWSTLYDKATSNIQVKEKNGKTKKIQTVDNTEFVITNSLFHLSKKANKDIPESYSKNFIKTAILSNGCSRMEIVKHNSNTTEIALNTVKISDEELFAACNGRTAHKGARHGLKALGKLARIEEQERKLLSLPQYKDYSHAKMSKKTDITLDNNAEKNKNKKSKKKNSKLESILPYGDLESRHEIYQIESNRKKKDKTNENRPSKSNDVNTDQNNTGRDTNNDFVKKKKKYVPIQGNSKRTCAAIDSYSAEESICVKKFKNEMQLEQIETINSTLQENSEHTSPNLRAKSKNKNKLQMQIVKKMNTNADTVKANLQVKKKGKGKSLCR